MKLMCAYMYLTENEARAAVCVETGLSDVFVSDDPTHRSQFADRPPSSII